uniref:Uncharacterized protein n=1 Tax=Rhizophora mucronata TaxID=61149 RepID=A0A2P2NBD7_RHIMU
MLVSASKQTILVEAFWSLAQAIKLGMDVYNQLLQKKHREMEALQSCNMISLKGLFP